MATARIGAYLERPPPGAGQYAMQRVSRFQFTCQHYQKAPSVQGLCMYRPGTGVSGILVDAVHVGRAAQRRVTQNLKIAHFGGNNHPAKVGSPTPIGGFSDVPGSLTPPSWDIRGISGTISCRSSRCLYQFNGTLTVPESSPI